MCVGVWLMLVLFLLCDVEMVLYFTDSSDAGSTRGSRFGSSASAV